MAKRASTTTPKPRRAQNEPAAAPPDTMGAHAGVNGTEPKEDDIRRRAYERVRDQALVAVAMQLAARVRGASTRGRGRTSPGRLRMSRAGRLAHPRH